jgi:nucleotide-binding universal stress UspA family protein
MNLTMFLIVGLTVAVAAYLTIVSLRERRASPPKPHEPAGVQMEHTPSPTRTPRLLVAVDGSPTSFATIAEVAARPWPSGSEIEVVTVIHSPVPVFPDPAFSVVAVHVEDEKRQQLEAPALMEAAVGRLRTSSPGVTVSSRVLEGDPAKVIVDEAERLRADEIFVGSHGYGPIRRGVMGSVSQKVALHAHCSVHIVRPPREGAVAAA